MIEITFLRHGRSRADDEGVYEGWYDSPLTEVGIAQAHARAEAWKAAGACFDRVISSPFLRAYETARIIAEALNAPLTTDPDWREMNNGGIAGLPRAEADRRFPHPEFRSPYMPVAETGETEYQLQNRAARAVERIIQAGEASTLVVAHGGILNAALRHITGAPVPVNFSGIWFSFGNTGYARFQYDPKRHVWRMKELRDL